MKNLLFTLISILGFCGLSFSQTLTQTVRGKVIDKATLEPIIGATIVLLNSDPLKGTTTNIDGDFVMESVPVGRQSLEIGSIGYTSYSVNDLLINSGKQVVLNISLEEKVYEFSTVVIRPEKQKERPTNTLATLSSRQFTVEETQRYAGGLNDPARLVSSFAGVTTPSISSNGISVRGNSPSGLLWRIEGVEVPSPNHFADLTIAGAGLLTTLSSQVMANSDFYMGAFPAEYGNATSGVFDIKLRTGNSSQRESTIQAGLLGVDFATEGPFKTGKKASYLFNYRYSTMALISPLLPSNSGVLEYQDLSYKINLPTENTGTFSIWGTGALDGIDIDALESDEWEAITDRDNSQTSLYMFASGVNHKTSVGNGKTLKTAFSVTGSGLSHQEQRLNTELQAQPQSDASKNDYRIILQSDLTQYIGDKHTNRTGFYLTHLGYDLEIEESLMAGESLSKLVDEKGQSDLLQFYSQSRVKLAEPLTLNAGFHLQYFDLNKELSLEPRIAMEYQLDARQSLALAYGLHSRIESLPVYFITDSGSQPNKDLKLMKSNHFVLSYTSMLTEEIKLSVEPYYQYLRNVPVSRDSYVSTLNIQNSLFFNEVLVSDGTGRNIGIDVTLEHYLKNGFYSMLTGSVFDSEYTAKDGITRNTRFNKSYVINALVGKEWQVGRDNNNLLSANIRLNYLGGNRIEAIDEQSSINQQEIVYGETSAKTSFADRHPDIPITSFTVSYRRNKLKYSSEWSLQVLNAAASKDYSHDFYNLKTNEVETKYEGLLIPNISYKIEF
jgi:hypothetical protein